MNKFRLGAYLTWIGLLLCYSFSVTSDRSLMKIPKKVWSVFAGDLDQDNDIDLISGHKVTIEHDDIALTILVNDGSGNYFVSDTSKRYHGNQQNIFAININNDNWPDIVSYYVESNNGISQYLKIWYNDNGDFNEFIDVDLNSTVTFSGITYCDFNGDGFNDIVVYANTENLWGILYNTGNGDFNNPIYYSLSYPPQDIECNDLNGDGKDEIIISGMPSEIYWYDSTNLVKTILDSAFTDKTKVCDVDNDSDNDIIAFKFVPIVNYTDVIIFRNDAGSFTRLQSLQFQPMTYDAIVNDFNNDNLPDLAFMFFAPEVTPENPPGFAKGIQINFNNANYQFSEQDSAITYYGGEMWRDFTSADFDGNGFADLAVTRFFSADWPNNLEILYNDGSGNFQSTPLKINQNPLPVTFYCYPNPFHETINIQYQPSIPGKVEFALVDINGHILKSIQTESQSGKNETTLKMLSDLNEGVYFLGIILNDKLVSIHKIIKI